MLSGREVDPPACGDEWSETIERPNDDVSADGGSSVEGSASLTETGDDGRDVEEDETDTEEEKGLPSTEPNDDMGEEDSDESM